jgi:cyclopropane fatty-acyl-phospholipid synthase-like methyltransferase
VEDTRLKLRAKGKEISFFPGMKILDAGCNAARLMYYFIDRYSATGYGADINDSGISIAKSADLWNEARVERADLVNSDYFSRFHDKELDLTIWSSHLNHVLHLQKVDDYINNVKAKSRQILLVDKDTPQLQEKLTQHGFYFFAEVGKVYACIS